MSRRRANMLANQIKDQFVNAPPQIRVRSYCLLFKGEFYNQVSKSLLEIHLFRPGEACDDQKLS